MKKVLTFLFSVFLICGLFVSCNNSAVEEKNGLASVSFEESILSTKALSASIDAKGVEDVYWRYTAVRTTEGPKQGATASLNEEDALPVWKSDDANKKGLAGKIVTLSAGSWKFRLYGYTSDASTSTDYKVYDTSYTGTDGATGTVKASQITKVKVDCQPSTQGNGKLAIKSLTVPEGTTTPKVYYKYKTNGTEYSAWTSITDLSTGIEKGLSGGIYTVTIGAFYNLAESTDPESSTNPEREGSIAVQIYSNLTTTITGSIDDLTGGVEFDTDPEVPTAKRYMVKYDGNEETSGNVPSAVKAYKSGETVTILGNTATEPLTKDGHTFGGWTTSSDGTGTVYKKNDSFVITEDTILYAKWNALKCLDFSSDQSFTLGFDIGCYGPIYKEEEKKLFISDDNSDWTTVTDGSETKTAKPGTDGKYHVYVRGKGLTTLYDADYDYKTIFKLTGDATVISCSGDVMTLLDYENPSSVTMDEYAFVELFSGCASLTTAPTLPATTLANNCYGGMFSGCTSLTTAPALPATTLADYCYYNMFSGCTSLTTAPALPATKAAKGCYTYMFSGCTSLTTAPALPATLLVSPDTSDQPGCYGYMFSGCTSLTTIPALPATTLAGCCYYFMFNGCKSLKFSATQTAEYPNAYRIPTTGDGVTAEYWNSHMFEGTSGTFSGNPSINTTYYTNATIIQP